MELGGRLGKEVEKHKREVPKANRAKSNNPKPNLAFSCQKPHGLTDSTMRLPWEACGGSR